MHVILYARSDCHLCDAFHFELLDLQNELGFVYEQRHLQEGDTLFAEFAGHFPVVDIETSAPQSIRLMDLASQPQLRAQIRQSAGLGMQAQAA